MEFGAKTNDIHNVVTYLSFFLYTYTQTHTRTHFSIRPSFFQTHLSQCDQIWGNFA